MSNNILYPHTAITSWSGFIYQGKVAIYHALTLLDHSDYVLQLDSLEDFAILDANRDVVSMHQIKALKSQSFSTYCSEFIKLKSKITSENCQNACFHLAKNITNKSIADIENEFSPIKIYKYGSNDYCPVDEIDKKIEEKLIKLLHVYHAGDPSKHSMDYACKVRVYLDQVITEKILAIHGKIHASMAPETEVAYKEIIPLQIFLDLIQEDLNQRVENDYYFYLLLGDFRRYFMEFCSENEDDLKESDLKRLYAVVKEINDFDKAQIIRFIKNIMPHRTFKFETIADYKDKAIQSTEIKDGFFRILSEIKNIPTYHNLIFLQWTSSHKSYAPSSINLGHSHSKKICNDIIQNALDNDLDVMFEGSHIITTDIDIDSISSPEVLAKFDPKVHQHIMGWKKVTLKSLENAKREINE
ncbi:MAG: hypothetical protein PHN18_10595 [Sulfurospirillaceae bacterium]|nr:hypothetical protein [Sulfurospirillaceae bacterium]MDD2827411.1 hypothetical protein [Sulfurospirillaceae bacterium]